MSDLRKLSRSISIGAGSAGTIALLLGATNVRAADDQIIDEVVVTAQKRTQALIDVPVSITAVDGDVLERQQASNFQDYLKLVPGLQLNQNTPGNGRLVMRGVNTGGVASTVAVYVDETPFGSSSGLVNAAAIAGDFDTFDLQRIEVLRGPQGTLYGASSLGGVLRFVTNQPQMESFESKVRVGAESVEDGEIGYSGDGIVNIPLSETFAIRGVGYYREQAGFVDSIGTAGSDIQDDINGSESYGGRLSACGPRRCALVATHALAQNLSTTLQQVESNANTLDTLMAGCRSRSTCRSSTTSTIVSTTPRSTGISALRRSRPRPLQRVRVAVPHRRHVAAQ